MWLLSGFKCQPYMTTIQPYICYLFFPFFTSFREAIADFLNDHMKPVEPILPENVCKIMDRYDRLKLPVPSLIVSINFPVGNRVNPPQSYTNMKIFLDPWSDYCFTYSACSHPTGLLFINCSHTAFTNHLVRFTCKDLIFNSQDLTVYSPLYLLHISLLINHKN